ncbi:hypothetical protein WNY61_18765 [Sulfitobacter sp. AS92]|uniref:Flp family type IVb pilin n=1 Tax=Sulfitobacter sp. AS92 TaxID=3135783 RepID=UPI00317571C2
MKFSLNMKRFSRDEDGAVTVDWVVLTAAIVGLAIIAFGAIETATSNLTVDIASDIALQ